MVNEGTNASGQACKPVEADPANPVLQPGDTDASGCTVMNNVGSTVNKFGWALTVSGKISAPWLNTADNILFQLNYGTGLGRYLTDLSSIEGLGIDGGSDGFIDPNTGTLKRLPIFGGYVAFQHWWAKGLRSTFLVSHINIDNDSSQPNSSYETTSRIAGNLIWSPVKSIDLGGELLYGYRKNKGRDTPDPATNPNGTNRRDGSALQIQLQAVYRF